MAVGDVVNLVRPQFQTNERLDLVDANPLTQAPLDLLAVAIKALLGKPPCTPAAAFPAGCGWQVVKPTVTSGAAYQLTIGTDLVVGVDADGNLIVKESGTSVTINGCATGVQYLYMYKTEADSNTESRRFIPAVSPFNEYTSSIPTRKTGSYGFYVAPVSQPLVVQAAIGSSQYALVSLGQATFDGSGTLTSFSPTTNFLSNVEDPGTFVFPTDGSTPNGVTDILTYAKAIATRLSDSVWGGAPNAHMGGSARGPTNNWNAWKPAGTFRAGTPAIGLETTNRELYGAVTVGDGVNTFGDIDCGGVDFATPELLFKHIFDTGGVYVLKPGSVFQFTANATVSGAFLTTPVTIYGQNVTVDLHGTTFTIPFAGGIGATFRDINFKDTVGSGQIVFTGDASHVTYGVSFIRCTLTGLGGTALVSGSFMSNFAMDSCFGVVTPSGNTSVPGILSLTSASDVRITNNRFLNNSSGFVSGMVSLTTITDDIVVEGNTFTSFAGFGGLASSTAFALVVTSDYSRQYFNRRVANNKFDGNILSSITTTRSGMRGIQYVDVVDVETTGNTFSRVVSAVEFSLSAVSPTSPLRLGIVCSGNKIRVADAYGISFNTQLLAAVAGLVIDDNLFADVKLHHAVSISGSSTDLREVSVSGNTFYNVGEDVHSDFSSRDSVAISVAGLQQVEQLTIQDNKFNRIANIPIYVTSPIARGVYVMDNTSQFVYTPETHSTPNVSFPGDATGTVGLLCLLNCATSIEDVSVQGNHLLDSITNNGTLSGRPGMVVAVSALVRGVTVQKNTLYNVGDSFSGTGLTAYLAIIGATGSAGVQAVSVSENQASGLSATAVIGARIGISSASATVQHVRFDRNTIKLQYDATLSAQGLHVFEIINGSGNTAPSITDLSMCGNKIYGFTGASAAWLSHGYRSNMNVNGVLMQHNTFFASGSWGATPTPQWGISFAGKAITNYSIQNNIATCGTYGVDGDQSPNFCNPMNANIEGGVATDGNSNTNDHIKQYMGSAFQGQAPGSPGDPASYGARNRGFD